MQFFPDLPLPSLFQNWKNVYAKNLASFVTVEILVTLFFKQALWKQKVYV